MRKIKCYKLEIHGSFLIDASLENILETLKVEIEENLSLDENIETEISLVEMSEDEYNSLPEFDGF